MSPEEARQAVRDGARCVMRYASADLRTWPHGWGRIIGYSDAPQVLIETPTGEKVWWRADLTSAAPHAPSTAPLTAEQPPADHGDGSGAGGGAEGEGAA